MAIIGTAAIITRVKAVLWEYLPDEMLNIDTDANAVATGDFDSFNSPELTEDDIQAFVDRRHECKYRLVIRDLGRDPESIIFQDHEGAVANMPRLDIGHDIDISCIVTTRGGDWGPDGAWHRCDRLANGVNVILNTYPKLTATGLTALVKITTLIGDAPAGETQEDDEVTITRTLSYRFRTIGSR